MAIEITDDIYKDITFTSYNKLNRIESMDLSMGAASIRMAKYSSKEHRDEKPGDLIENRDFHTINMEAADLKVIQDIIYKYISELNEYKEGTKI